MAEGDLLALIKRLETVANKLEKSAPGSASSGKFSNEEIILHDLHFFSRIIQDKTLDYLCTL